MAPKTTLNAKNLEALGAERLAELLIEISTGDAAIKRRLRLELAGAQSPGDVAKEVRKRLATIARSRSFVDWQNKRTLTDDLEVQRRAIVETIGKSDPKEALNLLWQFMGLAESVYNRCDDSSGMVGGIFQDACQSLGDLASRAKTDPVRLADQTYDALVANGYGQFDGLIATLAPALGQQGLAHLKQRIIDLGNQPKTRPADKDRVTVGWGSGSGRIYQDQIEETSRVSTVRRALQDIADAQGDADAYTAQYDEKTRKVPKIAAEIAERLLAAGRAEDALTLLDAAEHRQTDWIWPDFSWEDARIAALDALSRGAEAQAARWSVFEKSLSSKHLRDHLKRLPDFEDVIAEEKALDYAEKVKSALSALSFLVAWPALDRAAKIVLARHGELDGNHYELLSLAADALAGKYPLAATLVLRAMIDYCLTNSKTSRYKHAARHLLECSSLAATISDYGSHSDHNVYETRLRREHGKKTSFWNLIS